MQEKNGQIKTNFHYFMAPNAVFNQDINKNELLVYLYLCRCGNNGGMAFPSYQTIADKCKLSKRAVIKAVNTLETKGFIAKVIRKTDDGGNQSNIYEVKVHFEEIAPPLVHPVHPPSAPCAPPLVHPVHPIKNHIYKEPIINIATQEKKRISAIIKYAEFVSMTETEYNKLITRYGENRTKRMVEILDNYKGATGKTYKSDYRAILNWVVTEEEKRSKHTAKDNWADLKFI